MAGEKSCFVYATEVWLWQIAKGISRKACQALTSGGSRVTAPAVSLRR